MGGLARRAGALKEFAGKHAGRPFLILETGNAMKQTDLLGDPASAWVVEAFSTLGTHAVNTGGADLKRLNKMAELGRIPNPLSTVFVASMLGTPPPGSFPVQPYSIQKIEAADGSAEAKVAIFGLSQGSGDWEGYPDALSAESALEKLLRDADVQADVIVVMTRTTDPDLARLAGSFPGIDVIVNGSATGEGRELALIGSTIIVESAHAGIALGMLEIEWDAQGRIRKHSNQFLPLHPMVPSDPSMMKIVAQAHTESVKYQEAEALKSPPVTMPSIFAGSKACKDCHEEAYRVWEKSGHAHALETLKKTGDHFNPSCLECHVTGYGVGRGFVNAVRTPDLADVHCEACHGAAVDHSRRPQTVHPGIGQLQEVRRTVRREFCLRCHTAENSPAFKFEEYWKKIAH